MGYTPAQNELEDLIADRKRREAESETAKLLAANRKLKEENARLAETIRRAEISAIGCVAYDDLQADFSSKLKEHDGHSRRDEGYQAGVLACKSILKSAYDCQSWQ